MKIVKKHFVILIVFIGICFWVETLLVQRTSDVAASANIEIGASAPSDLAWYADETATDAGDSKNSMSKTTVLMLLGIGIVGLVTIAQNKF